MPPTQAGVGFCGLLRLLIVDSPPPPAGRQHAHQAAAGAGGPLQPPRREGDRLPAVLQGWWRRPEPHWGQPVATVGQKHTAHLTHMCRKHIFSPSRSETPPNKRCRRSAHFARWGLLSSPLIYVPHNYLPSLVAGIGIGSWGLVGGDCHSLCTCAGWCCTTQTGTRRTMRRRWPECGGRGRRRRSSSTVS